MKNDSLITQLEKIKKDTGNMMKNYEMEFSVTDGLQGYSMSIPSTKKVYRESAHKIADLHNLIIKFENSKGIEAVKLAGEIESRYASIMPESKKLWDYLKKGLSKKGKADANVLERRKKIATLYYSLLQNGRNKGWIVHEIKKSIGQKYDREIWRITSEIDGQKETADKIQREQKEKHNRDYSVEWDSNNCRWIARKI